MRLKNYFSRGDTIIEVMLAFTIFSMLSVGALTVMNQGTAGAQDSLETTLVRQQIDNQAEMLRYLHQAYLSDANNATAGSLPAKFSSIVSFAQTADLRQPTDFGSPGCAQTIPGDASKRFMLNSIGSMLNNANIRPANSTTDSPYARLMDDSVTSYGMWIEPVISNPTEDTARYIDFHIRACWNSAAASPQRTLGTIVRLYVPQNVDTGTTGSGGGNIPTNPTGRYTIAGANTQDCFPHKDLERADSELIPSWAVFSEYSSDPDGTNGSRGISRSPSAYTCQRPGGSTGSVYSCANYDARYRPSVSSTDSGNDFSMTISYYDTYCGGNSVVSSYNFKIGVYVNGTLRTQQDLSISMTSKTFDIGTLSSSDTVEVRWWNNHFFGPSNYEDPDFLIQDITFQRKS